MDFWDLYNDAGEILFIPAVGGRTFSSGATTYNGYGEYWSSTGSSGSSPFSACWMELSETSVYIRSNSSISKSHGLSVRCVKD
ncbi:hypothetical protein FACS189432_09800 [Bacteroidia bacterium]|nr:hypothetical protein FACS189432_09800 [Bacteroidia bacterium]